MVGGKYASLCYGIKQQDKIPFLVIKIWRGHISPSPVAESEWLAGIKLQQDVCLPILSTTL